MINVTAKSFSGKYGTDNEVGDIIHVNIKVDDTNNTNSENKEIIFLTDVSGSMESSMKEVKSSLLAFRDSLVGKNPTEMEKFSPVTREELLKHSIKTRLITFSNEAREVWSSGCDDGDTFENIVTGLRTEALTNMGDALKMAFDKTDNNVFTWIVAMTDGESNRGSCRTRDSFQRMVTSNKPLNSKIVSLGYGTKFDPEVLNVVGTFAYLEDSETIPIVLGNVSEEVASAVGFNCVVDINEMELASEFTEDTIIVPEGQGDKTPGKIIVGNRVVGSLCSGKSYDIIYLPHGNNKSSELEKYNTITVRYTDIKTGNDVELTSGIVHTNDEPSDNIRKLYFAAETKRLIYNLYRSIQLNPRSLNKTIKYVENKINDWSDSISDEYKEEIKKLLEDIKHQDNSDITHQSSTCLNKAIGSGYTLYTGGYATSALNSTKYYMESPLVNNN